MKTPLISFIRPGHRTWFPNIFAAGLLAVVGVAGQRAQAADIYWNTGAGTFTNTLNWIGGVVPSSGDIADFNTNLITGNPNITLNLNPASVVQVGSVVAGNNNASNFRITANSAAVSPTTLNLNGVGGILLSNYSSFQIIISNSPTVGGALLNLGLGGSGNIYANYTGSLLLPPTDSSGGEIVVYSSITGSGSITNTGPGILYFGTNNTYTGSTTLSAGALELSPGGTIGNGTGTLYFSGGNLETGGSSTTRIIANPIVVNTPGNAYIYNRAGTAGTRVFAFSSSLGGTSGTLVIGNVNTTANEFFDVQMLGTFTFNLPLVVGDNFDSYSDNYPSDFSELQLGNSTATGPQTFNGNISGDGPIFRGNVSSSVSVSGDNGTTIFTASNSYTGGTTINNGTLFANNTTGSALGSGTVTVTNTGILAGNGYVVAPTMIGGASGGTIQPGSTATNVGNLHISSLTFNPGATYKWQITSTNGTAGTTWDLITCSSGWTDAGSSIASPITISLTTLKAVTNWDSTKSYSWMVISNSGSATGFNAANWAINSSGFSANNTVAGVFGLTADGNGDLILNYTPTSGNILIDVESGTVGQESVTPVNYPVLTGVNSVTKVGNGEVIMDNSANSYQGATYIDAGTASASVNSTTAGGAFGASTIALTLGNSTGSSSNATLNIDQAGVNVANAVVVQSGNAGTKTIGTTITSGLATYNGTVSLLDNVTLSAPAGGADLFSGNFSGTGGINFADIGTITMAGTGSYNGPTTLTGGGLLNLNASTLGTNTFTISATSTLDNTSGSSVTLANNPPQNWNADFTFTGSSSLSLGTGAVTMSANRILTVNGSILTVGGPIAGAGFGLTKTGAGELSLTSATTNSYTGGTTNLAGILAINATATFGNGTGPLVLSGGNILNTGTRAGAPIANPVIMNTTTRFYGNSTDTSSPNRYFPFTGVFTVTGGSSLDIDNLGVAKTIFNLSLQGTNYTTINWPIVIGDPGFDTSGALTVLNLINDNTTPVQTINSLISGTGSIIRGANTLNTGGTTVLTAQNTFSGGVSLTSGALGLGASSTLSGGAVVSGPLGTALLTVGTGSSTGETNVTLYAVGGPVEIDNKLYINGYTNLTFGGTNNILFTGPVDSGNSAKSLVVASGITINLAGAITNSGSSGGGPLTKLGGGVLILGGTNTYIGSTTVNTGKLLVNGINGTNLVTVNPAGILGGTGVISGSLTFSSSGGQAYLYKTAGSPDSPLTVSSNLTLSGNTVTVDLGGTTTLGLGTYTLLTYGGTLSGSFSTVPTIVNGSLASGKTATINLSTPNQVNLVVATGSSTPPGFSSGSIGLLPTGNISLTATGALGTSYRLWATTNLTLAPVTSTWTLLNSGTISVSPFTNYDLTATNFPKRFYLFTTP